MNNNIGFNCDDKFDIDNKINWPHTHSERGRYSLSTCFTKTLWFTGNNNYFNLNIRGG